ncbi:hypothetical protein Arad_12261 (plasmid) [Rhizobium rhizogenes K84]|uniref:Uncharacterized protein n=1 Tax=Rhizobium rhizogenes (strain K84 / ATCC BAA-868) TaxID=311403 RepID=B9JQ58_RHIR8|nr:hypothetical protein Arad_12261 [Rhizobium rhizogenes K84]
MCQLQRSAQGIHRSDAVFTSGPTVPVVVSFQLYLQL